ncbi:penicillin-binding protein 1C [Chitinimonas arctica]|uniref:peptidoglycan glycosyltransferase n=1 Tax=Chitinimonas arctica TaxID=2594795 RepID=A0A516SGF7_9NEIS|nr:penicillin-binding protein 1C [Chitinimonas arctica]QDQ27108.1 penicillin-binding protein 1C [Chitinimonas arctica]
MITTQQSRSTASDWRYAARFRLAAIILFLPLLSACAPAPSAEQVRHAWRSSEALLLDRQGQPLQAVRIDPQERRLQWVGLDAVSPRLVEAVLAAEDRHFFEHGGIDWTALGAAAIDSASGDVRGASTITMQLAGLLDPALRLRNGRRSLWQKTGQMWAASRIETAWSKRQILEAYLNLAPFRGELVGIDAASRLLFGKAPASLDQHDALLLASLLRSPNTGAETAARRACALAASTATPAGDCAVLRAHALAVLIAPQQRLPGANEAPELAALLKPSAGQRLHTSLDGHLQAEVRRQLRENLAQLQGRNVRDAAAVVIDNQSGEVLAWVGTPGAGAGARFVDGVLAPRQAGSTLKPFLYQLAIERKLLTPASLLDDSPVALDTPAGQYIPQNYDHSFRGPVSVRTSLASSLNIPAVRTLLLVGLDDFHARLKQLGLNLPQPPEHYGYGLALGAAEVRLIDLANAYRTLANGGRQSPWRLSSPPGRHSLAGPAVLDSAASWLVGDILSDRAARAPAFGLDNALATPSWTAVKTGTSKDMRDNWAVGFTRRHTIAVWVGNADGEAMWDVSGVSGAAPAWRAIVARLGDGAIAPPMLAGIEARSIHYQPAVEAARREYFLAGTGQDSVELASSRLGPTIVYPAEQLIVALDPDIPVERQRLQLRAANADGLFWQLDGQRLGPAGTARYWRPVAGKHRLALVDSGGGQRALVSFQVRGQL